VRAIGRVLRMELPQGENVRPKKITSVAPMAFKWRGGQRGGGGSGLEHQVARRGGGPDRRVVMAGSNPLPADAGDAWQGDSRQWR
jgi:hypothetical protein